MGAARGAVRRFAGGRFLDGAHICRPDRRRSSSACHNNAPVESHLSLAPCGRLRNRAYYNYYYTETLLYTGTVIGKFQAAFDRFLSLTVRPSPFLTPFARLTVRRVSATVRVRSENVFEIIYPPPSDQSGTQYIYIHAYNKPSRYPSRYSRSMCNGRWVNGTASALES